MKNLLLSYKNNNAIKCINATMIIINKKNLEEKWQAY